MPNHASSTVIGHLGRDASTKFLPNEKAVVSFSIATSRKRKGKDGQPEEITTWWSCQWWGDRAAKVAEYLTKGKAVMVQGDTWVRQYEGRDGGKAQSLEIEVRELVLLGGGEQAKGGDEGPAPVAQEPGRRHVPRPSVDADGEPPF
jgi:single-strand DNA-binding protein